MSGWSIANTDLHPAHRSAEELHFPAGSLVLIAGLPGAGKSTLLRRLYRFRGDETQPVPVADHVQVIDSWQSRNWWAGKIDRLPPRARIPLVYGTHVWRIARTLLSGNAVVAHTRGTWPVLLYGLAWLARRAGTELHLVLLDVPPRTARAGQYSRGRVLTTTTFARHVRRWRRLVTRARSGRLPPAASVTVLDRAAADQLDDIRLDLPRVRQSRAWARRK